FVAPLARVRGAEGEHVLYDALGDPLFGMALLEAISRRRTWTGAGGRVIASPTAAFRRVRGPAGLPLEAMPLQAEQTNTSIQYGDRMVLKLFRRLDEGMNPEIEIGRFLTDRARFTHVPQVGGALDYVPPGGRPASLGILQSFVPNEGDAWQFTMDSLRAYV